METKNRFEKRPDKKSVPAEAFIFNYSGQAQSFADTEGGEKNNIRLVLYDGSIVKHWYWGNMAFDLETIRLSKNKIPILVDHRTDLRIGYSTGFSKDGKFVLEGKYLKGSEEAER
ncbi:MAG TPA: hypothetical protein PLD68_12300, partial [Clostridiales bacterium]|nr:hypothetical protein [Clostridiales bacterium]